MGIGTSTEYNQIMSQLQGIMAQSGNFGAGSVAGGFQFGNDLWSDMERLTSGDSSQQAQVITNLPSKIMSLINKFSGNRKAEASQKDKQLQKAAEDNNKLQQQQQAKLEQDIAAANASISEHLQNADSLIKSLQDSGKDVSAQQEKVQEIKTQIEQKQNELKNAKTEDEKKDLLKELQALGQNLGTVVAELQSIKDNVDSTAESAEAEQQTASETNDNAVATIEAGQNDGQQLASNLGQTAGDVATQQAEAVQDGVQGQAFEQMAQTASSTSFFTFGAGASAQIKFQQLATDCFNAQSIGQSGAVTNFANLSNGVVGLSGNLSMLTNFSSSIGSFDSSFNNVIGEFNTGLNPLLTSIGSFSGVDTSASEVQDNAEQDMQTVQAQESQEDNNGDSQDGSGQLKSTNTDTSKLDKIKVE